MQEKSIGKLVKILMILCVISVFVMACKPKEKTSTDNLPDTEVVELDKDFVEFYEKFHADSIFQLNTVQFPLKRSTQDSIQIPWNKESWILHKPFSDFGGKFRREFTVLGKLVIENIYDANGYFSMERRFAKLHDGWMLIYYEVVRK